MAKSTSRQRFWYIPAATAIVAIVVMFAYQVWALRQKQLASGDTGAGNKKEVAAGELGGPVSDPSALLAKLDKSGSEATEIVPEPKQPSPPKLESSTDAADPFDGPEMDAHDKSARTDDALEFPAPERFDALPPERPQTGTTSDFTDEQPADKQMDNDVKSPGLEFDAAPPAIRDEPVKTDSGADTQPVHRGDPGALDFVEPQAEPEIITGNGAQQKEPALDDLQGEPVLEQQRDAPPASQPSEGAAVPALDPAADPAPAPAVVDDSPSVSEKGNDVPNDLPPIPKDPPAQSRPLLESNKDADPLIDETPAAGQGKSNEPPSISVPPQEPTELPSLDADVKRDNVKQSDPLPVDSGTPTDPSPLDSNPLEPETKPVESQPPPTDSAPAADPQPIESNPPVEKTAPRSSLPLPILSIDVGQESQTSPLIQPPAAEQPEVEPPAVQQPATQVPAATQPATPAAKPSLKVAVVNDGRAWAGAIVPFVYTVQNAGRAAVSDVVLRTHLSEGLDHRLGRVLNYHIRSLNPGETQTVRLNPRSSRGGIVTVAAEVFADGQSIGTAQTKLVVEMRANYPPAPNVFQPPSPMLECPVPDLEGGWDY